MNLYDYLEMYTKETKAKFAALRGEKPIPSQDTDVPAWIKSFLKTYHEFENPRDLENIRFINKFEILTNKLINSNINKLVIDHNNFYSCNAGKNVHDDILVWMHINHKINLTVDEFKKWNSPNDNPNLKMICLEQHKVNKPYFILSESYTDKEVYSIKEHFAPFKKVFDKYNFKIAFISAREFNHDIESEIEKIK